MEGCGEGGREGEGGGGVDGVFVGAVGEEPDGVGVVAEGREDIGEGVVTAIWEGAEMRGYLGISVLAGPVRKYQKVR